MRLLLIGVVLAGIPTAWIATWESGHPVIVLGSDVDCIPQAGTVRDQIYRHTSGAW